MGVNKDMNMDPQDNKTPKQPSTGYGKRPKWHWVLLYLVVAVIVYGVVYYVFFHKTGGSTGGYSY